MSKLPEHLKPIEDFYLYGVNVKDMDREDLLKVIQWLASEMHHYKKSAEDTGSEFANYIRSTRL